VSVSILEELVILLPEVISHLSGVFNFFGDVCGAF